MLLMNNNTSITSPFTEKTNRLIEAKNNITVTHSSTNKNLSPSEPKHLPLLLSLGPSITMGCLTPDWNHVPSQRSGKSQVPVTRDASLYLFVTLLIQ